MNWRIARDLSLLAVGLLGAAVLALAQTSRDELIANGAKAYGGAELSEAATGLQVWAHRYDADLADFFVLQDQIAGPVMNKRFECGMIP